MVVRGEHLHLEDELRFDHRETIEVAVGVEEGVVWTG